MMSFINANKLKLASFSQDLMERSDTDKKNGSLEKEWVYIKKMFTLSCYTWINQGCITCPKSHRDVLAELGWSSGPWCPKVNRATWTWLLSSGHSHVECRLLSIVQAVLFPALQIGQGQLGVLKTCCSPRSFYGTKWLQTQTMRKRKHPSSLNLHQSSPLLLPKGISSSFFFNFQLGPCFFISAPVIIMETSTPPGTTMQSPDLSLYWSYYFQCSCCLSLLSLDSFIMNDVTTSWFQAAFLTSPTPHVQATYSRTPTATTLVSLSTIFLSTLPLLPTRSHCLSSSLLLFKYLHLLAFPILHDTQVAKLQTVVKPNHPPIPSHTETTYVARSATPRLAGSSQIGHWNSKGHPETWVTWWHFLHKCVLCSGFSLLLTVSIWAVISQTDVIHSLGSFSVLKCILSGSSSLCFIFRKN